MDKQKMIPKKLHDKLMKEKTEEHLKLLDQRQEAKEKIQQLEKQIIRLKMFIQDDRKEQIKQLESKYSKQDIQMQILVSKFAKLYSENNELKFKNKSLQEQLKERQNVDAKAVSEQDEEEQEEVQQDEHPSGQEEVQQDYFYHEVNGVLMTIQERIDLLKESVCAYRRELESDNLSAEEVERWVHAQQYEWEEKFKIPHERPQEYIIEEIPKGSAVATRVKEETQTAVKLENKKRKRSETNDTPSPKRRKQHHQKMREMDENKDGTQHHQNNHCIMGHQDDNDNDIDMNDEQNPIDSEDKQIIEAGDNINIVHDNDKHQEMDDGKDNGGNKNKQKKIIKPTRILPFRSAHITSTTEAPLTDLQRYQKIFEKEQKFGGEGFWKCRRKLSGSTTCSSKHFKLIPYNIAAKASAEEQQINIVHSFLCDMDGCSRVKVGGSVIAKCAECEGDWCMDCGVYAKLYGFQ